MAGRINQKGRNGKAGRFVALPHRVLISTAYGSLDLTARALLTELVMLHNGENNGSLWLSVRDAAGRLGKTDCHAACRAFNDLADRGLIQLTKDAHFSVKSGDSSRARCWRLPWLVWSEGPKGKRAPCWDFEKYQVPSTEDAHNRRALKRATVRDEAMKRWRKAQSENRLPVVDFTTMEAPLTLNRPAPVVELTTANQKNDAIPPFPVVVKSTTHLDVTTTLLFRCCGQPHVRDILSVWLALTIFSAHIEQYREAA